MRRGQSRRLTISSRHWMVPTEASTNNRERFCIKAWAVALWEQQRSVVTMTGKLLG